MKITSRRTLTVADQSTAPLDDRAVQRLSQMINDIGVARFEGRISAGLVDSYAGYAALDRFVSKQKRRSMLSDLTDVIFARERKEL